MAVNERLRAENRYSKIRRELPTGLECIDPRYVTDPLYFSISRDIRGLSGEEYRPEQILKMLYDHPQIGLQYTLNEMIHITIRGDLQDYLQKEFPGLIELVREYCNYYILLLGQFYERKKGEYFMVQNDRDEKKYTSLFKVFEDIKYNKFKFPAVVYKGIVNESEDYVYDSYIIITRNHGIAKYGLRKEQLKSFDELDHRLSDVKYNIKNPFNSGEIVIEKTTGRVGIVANNNDSEIKCNTVKVHSIYDFPIGFFKGSNGPIGAFEFNLLETERFHIENINRTFSINPSGKNCYHKKLSTLLNLLESFLDNDFGKIELSPLVDKSLPDSTIVISKELSDIIGNRKNITVNYNNDYYGGNCTEICVLKNIQVDEKMHGDMCAISEDIFYNLKIDKAIDFSMFGHFYIVDEKYN